MDDGYSPLSIVLFLMFILLEAGFYAFGAAVQNMNQGNLEQEKENGNKKAQKLLWIANQPAGFINSIQIMTNANAMVIGAYILGRWSKRLEALLKNPGMKDSWIHVVSLAVMGIVALVLLISFGVVIPKYCAAKKPEKWGYALLPFILAVLVPLKPFILAVTGISFVVLKVFGIDMNASGENVTEEEIMSMVNEGHEQGVLEAREAQMITNIFELDNKKAGDIMTHRTNLVMIDGETSLKDALGFILTEGKNSRYPVYEQDMDDIVGILHMKDAMIYAEREGRTQLPITKIPGLLREAHFIPESRNIDSLFREMQSQKTHIEVVVDEYGQIAPVYSISAGLDYPGIGPEHAHLHDIGRAEYVPVTDEEAVSAFEYLAKTEGIICAIESAHAVAHVRKIAPYMKREDIVIICLSGRGDKDVAAIARYRGVDIHE